MSDRYNVGLGQYCIGRKCFYICAHEHCSLSLRLGCSLRYRFGDSVCRVDLAKLNSRVLRDGRTQALMDPRGIGDRDCTLVLDREGVTGEGAVMSRLAISTHIGNLCKQSLTTSSPIEHICA